MGFSKGPWHVKVKGENFFGVQSNVGNVCIMAAAANKDIDKRANADLISVSPDLIEALESLVFEIKGDVSLIAGIDSRLLTRADAAIAKALGGHKK